MRCDQKPAAVLKLQKRTVRNHRLLLQHIQPGCRNQVLLQRRAQIGFLHHRSSCHIDQHCGRLHFLHGRQIDQSSRPVAQRTVQGKHIRLGQQRIKIHLLIIRAGTFTRCGIENYPAAKSLRDGGHLSSNISHAHNAPGLSFQFSKGHAEMGKTGLRGIHAVFHVIVIITQLFQKIERHGEGMLRHHRRGIIPHVHHGDSPAAAVIQVNIVKARREFTDQPDAGSAA